MKIAKYEFESKEQYETKFNALHTEDEEGNLIPNFKFAAVKLGHIVLTDGTYDEDGNELTAPVLSDKYHVDVMCLDTDTHPYGWAIYSVNTLNNGVHAFLGVDYLTNKIQ